MDREAVIGGTKGRFLSFCTPLVFSARAQFALHNV